MDRNIRLKLGIMQAEKLIPELLKLCESKQVKIINRQFKRINFLQGELTGTLNGDNTNYVLGWLDGYEKSFKLNYEKPSKNKLAPAK